MNRIVLIGNGFDLAHGLKTSYADFINWYWEQLMNKILSSMVSNIDDGLCKVKLRSDVYGFYNRVYGSACQPGGKGGSYVRLADGASDNLACAVRLRLARGGTAFTES